MTRQQTVTPDFERVLVVDDDERALALLCQVLERGGYEWVTAQNAAEARQRLAQSAFALLVTDVSMAGRSGVELVEHTLARYPETATIMVTESDDSQLALSAVELGAYGYIIKPFTESEITIAIHNALRRRELEIEHRTHREALEEIVRARTLALERSAKQLQLTREETVRRLSRAVEYRDEETGAHTERMSRYCGLLAERAGLDAESVRMASQMHDVGKVAIPDHILLKPGPLTEAERREMERHTEIGYEILSGSSSALLELAATIALTHHERFDGTGYPRRLAGSDIPIEGRAAAIADVFDALTSDRSYRAAYTLDQALQMLRAEHGRHFDPKLLDMFFASLDDVSEIRATYVDARVARAGLEPVIADPVHS